MGTKRIICKDTEEALRMYDAGLLIVNAGNSATGMHMWESTWGHSHWSRESVERRHRAALAGENYWLPEEFAYLVEDDNDN